MSLFSKYPELEPVSMFFKEKEGDYLQHEVVPEKIDADILFIFGIFPLSKNIKKLMKNQPTIELVFLVETINELLFFIKHKMDKGFDSERIHVHWKNEDKEDVEWAEEIAGIYPFENVSFLRNGLDEKRYELLRLTFLRKIVLETSVHKELLNYPLLCKNLFSNIYQLSNAFDIRLWKDHFKDIPVIIAGAGPSLQKEAENLKKIQHKALIFAGGSTITALDQMGIFPHMFFAIDPNQEEYQRLRHSHCLSAPLIYGNRVQKDIFRFFSGSIGYMRTDTGGLFEEYIDKTLGIKDYGILKNLSEEALSVTTIALMTAIYLGCSPIYFAGVDLSKKENTHYSGNIISNWEAIIKADCMQETKWTMEKDVIDNVVKNYQGQQFYDATGNGMTFANIKSKKINPNEFTNVPNLQMRIQNLILDTKFTVSHYEIMEIMKSIKISLDELCKLIKRYLAGDIVDNLFIYEVEANQSYTLFFKGMVYALQVPLMKKFKHESNDITAEKLLKNIYEKVLSEAIKLSSLI